MTGGWENIEPGERFSWRRGKGNVTTIDIPCGKYGFDKFQSIINGEPFGSLTINKENGLINLTVANQHEVRMTNGLLDLLGLDDGRGNRWIDAGIYIGDRLVNFATRKLLFIYLDQIDTTSNMVDGNRSTLLTTIGLGCHSYGDIGTVRMEHPEFKKLQNGTIHELKITIKDENGNVINNNDLPIYITLEIQ